MKIIQFFAIAASVYSMGLGTAPVWAADSMKHDTAEKIEKLDKDIAKDKEKVSSKKAEITAAQSKLDQNMNQFGKESKEVRDDRETIMNLRNEFVDLKASLYKDMNKKKVAEGQPVESDVNTSPSTPMTSVNPTS